MKPATLPRQTHAEMREQTRSKILDAALDIIVEEGIRAVRHRAVAKRAGVALGSTTYHFSSIEELIISAFQHWRTRALMLDNPLYRQTQALLEPYGDEPVPAPERASVAARIHAFSVRYLRDQLSGKREDRLLELAFHHESVRCAALHELVMGEWHAQLDFLSRVHRAMGSTRPAEDARITFALFRQLEQSAVIEDRSRPDLGTIRRTLQRHMTLCFGVELDPAPCKA